MYASYLQNQASSTDLSGSLTKLKPKNHDT